MEKHTPGPWTVGDYSEANYPRNWPEVAVHVGGPENRGNAIAIVYLGGGGATSTAREGILANARLIASAPKLLSELRMLANSASGFKWLDDRVSAALAVIADATG